VEQQDSKGNTVLHRAVTAVDANEVDRLAALLGAGANINATNAAGQTPLHVTANKICGWDLNLPGTNEPFQMLVYRKADVNALDNQGRTPLHVLAAADTSFKQEATQL
jgi:ankyrin repeat protein